MSESSQSTTSTVIDINNPTPKTYDPNGTMRAVVCRAPRTYTLETIPVPPPPKAGEILVRILAAGICASDAKCYEGAPLFWGDSARDPYCEPPIIPGHEFIAQVVQLGEGVTGYDVGDHIISEQIVPCGACRFCTNYYGGETYHMCQVNDIYGFHQKSPGAWCEFMIFPAGARNWKVPKELPIRSAVFIEPFSCSIHAVDRGNIKPGDCVVIAGCGTLGLAMVAAATQYKPGALVALDLNEHRLDIATRAGATHTFNPLQCNVIEEIKKLTEGYGCDVYIEASGSPASVKQGLHCIRKLGTFVEFSVFCFETSVDWTIIGDSKELTINGAHLGPVDCYQKAIDLLVKGIIPIDEIVDVLLPLEDYEKGLEMVLAGTHSIKVALVP